MRYISGDIIHINFPMDEGDGPQGEARFKARPALAVTDSDAHGTFVTVAVSSKGHHQNTVELKATDLAHGRLRETSFVRVDKIYTVNAQAVQAKMAVAKPELLARVRKLLCPTVGCK